MTALKGFRLKKGARSMRRRHKRHGGMARDLSLSQSCINASTVNITNVTNVAQVVNCGGRPKWHKHKRRDEGYNGKHDRKPKLLRYCASGGIIDHDVAEDMSNGELCDGFVEVGSYAAKGLKRTASKWAGDMGHHARGFFGSLFGIVEKYLS